MTTLLLYDFENVSSFAAPAAPATPGPRARWECAVVMAFGGQTAAMHRLLTFAALRASANAAVAHLAAALGRPVPRPPILEIALTLHVPEAADVALIRLVYTSTLATVGQYDEVVVLSADDTVRTLVRGLMPGGWCLDTLDVSGRRALRLWMPARRDARPLLRRAPAPHALGSIGRDPGSPTVVVDSPGAARHAAGRLVQVSGEIADIGRLVEACPTLLTQVGATASSTQGLSRLAKLARAPHSPLLLAPCGPGEGLELQGTLTPWPPKMADVRVVETALGEGAVRLEWGAPVRSLTLRTKLPCWLVKEVLEGGGTPPVGKRSWLDDAAVLRTWAPKQSSAVVRVSFTPPYPSIRCAIEPDEHGVPPTWWWSGERTTATAKRTFRAAWLLPRPIDDVAACSARDGDDLVVVSPIAATDEVTTERAAAKNRLVAGTSATGTRCALLTLAGRVHAGATFPVLPIQQIGAEELSQRGLPIDLCRELRSLPIVIPATTVSLVNGRGEK